jgi:hypothetical protein
MSDDWNAFHTWRARVCTRIGAGKRKQVLVSWFVRIAMQPDPGKRSSVASSADVVALRTKADQETKVDQNHACAF